MLTSGTPSRVFFDPKYPISKFKSLPMVFCTERFHCWEWPEPTFRSTPKYALAQPGIGIRRRDVDRGSRRQEECGMDIVLGLLSESLYKGKLRNRKWSGDARLFKPDHAISRA